MHQYNENDLLSFVKSRLGHPYNPIELNDEQIMDIFIKRVIPILSKAFPHRETVKLGHHNNVGHGTFRIEGIRDKGRRVINVGKVIPDFMRDGGYSLLMNSNAMEYTTNLLMNSMGKNPNTFTFDRDGDDYLIKISNLVNSGAHIILETTHAIDLSTLPMNLTDTIEIIALAEVSQVLIGIRSMYQSVNTSTGEINMNLDMLERHVEAYNNIKDELVKVAVFSKRTPLVIA